MAWPRGARVTPGRRPSAQMLILANVHTFVLIKKTTKLYEKLRFGTKIIYFLRMFEFLVWRCYLTDSIALKNCTRCLGDLFLEDIRSAA